MRWTEEMLRDYEARQGLVTPTIEEIGVSKGLPMPKKSGGPNKTELEYRHRLSLEFPGCPVKFEALTFHLLNGHAYTPDWIVYINPFHILCVEVKARGKNGYRQPSYQRAKVMYDQCRVEMPLPFEWRWAEKSGGEWQVG